MESETVGAEDEVDLDLDGMRLWLSEVFDPGLAVVTASRFARGSSSGAWRLEVSGPGVAHAAVLKAPTFPSPVHKRDACREARIMDALHRGGARVPAVLAVDEGSRAIGRPCFLMELVPGRSFSDAPPAGYYDDPEFRDAGVEGRRAIWESFHEGVAAVHRVDPATVPDARFGERGLADVLDYWHEALVDVVPAGAVPRQLAILDWLRSHLPPGADDDPALCIGDCRLVNGVVEGTELRGLVDFEVAYLGNPAADIAYSLLFDDLHREGASDPVSLPSHEETWERWSRATGRTVAHTDYWRAFAMTILCVTATRAMVQWGLAGEDVDSSNPLVPVWEAAIERARGAG